jgi:N6-L-threonylcarbamoyladenine synthase
MFQMKVLGIESSCDETAAAVVEDGQRVLSNVVVSQIDVHQAFGGVVPEVAARSHIEAAVPVVDQALREASEKPFRTSSWGYPQLRRGQATSHVTTGARSVPQKLRSEGFSAELPGLWDNIDAIAVANRPGLIGSLLIGTLTARTLALIKRKPLIAVDHVEAHVYANFIDNPALRFPLLALIISGGHTQIALFRGHGDYQIVGRTRDDAVGEAFDKVAKILGLPYPGGPAIAQEAQDGDPEKYHLPHPKLAEPLDFSFSGLKTALLRAVQAEVGQDYTFPSNALSGLLNDAQRQNFAASFQNTACQILTEKLLLAYQQYQPKSVVLAGGVSANQELRRQIKAQFPVEVHFPAPKYCTDNAAMVAALGYFQSRQQPAADPLTLEVSPSI